MREIVDPYGSKRSAYKSPWLRFGSIIWGVMSVVLTGLTAIAFGATWLQALLLSALIFAYGMARSAELTAVIVQIIERRTPLDD